MIRIRDLHRRFGDVVAVDGLDLDVAPGETFGLLGPNGAGKTTTIGCAIGLIRPDSGTVTLFDQGPPSDPAVRRRVGVAPQSLAIYGELTGAENVAFCAEVQGLRGADRTRRVRAALETTGLAERGDDRASGYSGGMQRRLNLACALVHDPDLLLLDEPTAGVDPQSRHHLLQSVRALRDRGRAVIYTTHYMEEAERVCDRVAIIDHGRVLAVGTVAELLRAHGGRSWLELEFGADAPHSVAAAAGLPEPDAATGIVRLPTDDATAELLRLRDAGVPYRTATVRHPDLETVFLKLTGRTLRDA